jgi:hypothetical protein
MRSKLLLVIAVTALSNGASAQVVDPGLLWIGIGTFAGTGCGGFTCTPVMTTVSPGEPATIQVRGLFATNWAVGLSASATQCLPIPGVVHNLALDFPIEVVLSGVFTDMDPIIICAGGRASVSFIFPFLPAGTTFSLQAVAHRTDLLPAFTKPITVTVL